MEKYKSKKKNVQTLLHLLTIFDIAFILQMHYNIYDDYANIGASRWTRRIS